MNIAVMRTFVSLRKLSVNYQEVMRVLEQMRGKYDAQFVGIYKVLERLVKPPQPPRRMIGFKAGKEDPQE